MAQSNRGVVKDGRQLRRDVRSMQLKGRRLDSLAYHFDTSADDLNATWSLLARYNVALDAQHRFRMQPSDAVYQSRILEDHLRRSLPIAQDEK